MIKCRKHILNITSHPGYFGKSGIRIFRQHKNRTFNPSVNIDKLWSLLSVEAQKKYTDAKCVTAPVIDVTKSGFFKVTLSKK